MKKQSHLRNDAPPELLAEIEFLEKWVLHHDENLNHDTMFHEQLADRRKQLKQYDTAEEATEPTKKESVGVGILGESKHGT